MRELTSCRVLAPFFTGLLSIACNSSPAPNASDPEACVQGWWVDSSVSPCSTCSGTGANPECAYQDCQQFGVEGFFADHTTFDGVLTYSPSGRTISTNGPGVRRPFSVSEGKIQLSGSQGSLTCTGSQLTGSYSYQVRAASNLTGALSAAADGVVSFRGAPVSN